MGEGARIIIILAFIDDDKIEEGEGEEGGAGGGIGGIEGREEFFGEEGDGIGGNGIEGIRTWGEDMNAGGMFTNFASEVINGDFATEVEDVHGGQ